MTSADPAPDPRLDPAVQRSLALLQTMPHAALRIGGLTARELADRFGTPFYAYDQHALQARTAAVQRALGSDIELLWSVKANPSVAITSLLRAAGVGAEIASLGELEVALAAGHDAAALRFAGPGKTDRELAAAAERGLGCFHVESPSEAESLAEIARAQGRRLGVAVRVNLAAAAQGARLRMGGSGARFGVDEAIVPNLLRAIAQQPGLELRGLHVYGGTQCFDAAAFLRQADMVAQLAARWERELSIRLDEIDLGGGFGVATYLGDPEFDLAAAGHGLQQLVREHARPRRRWFVELGRYLVAPCGTYVAAVARRKQNGDRTHLALDGGLHHCAIAAGLGSVLRRPPLLIGAGDDDPGQRETVAIGGPLCTPQDTFADAVLLAPCREGDLVAVLAVGAYGQSFSPTGFLSHATAIELLVADGIPRIVRGRGEPKDVLRGQSNGSPA